MKHRPLGAATVTAVGCGDVRLATAAARGIDARDVERALSQALELGITLVDVADEEPALQMCGTVVRDLRLRDRVVVATTIPVARPRLGVVFRDTLAERLPVKYVQERVEATLRATRFDVIPLAQLPVRPVWRDASAWPELAGVCERLVREGKVQQWGAIIDELERAPELASESWLVALSVVFNACMRTAEPVLAAAGKLAILARRPLAGGALAGILGPGVKLALHDERRTIDPATLERISIAMADLAPHVHRPPPAASASEAARAVLERSKRPPDLEAQTVAELALRYVIDRDTIALPRLHRPDHLAEAIHAASARPLSRDLRERLDQIFAPRDT